MTEFFHMKFVIIGYVSMDIKLQIDLMVTCIRKYRFPFERIIPLLILFDGIEPVFENLLNWHRKYKKK